VTICVHGNGLDPTFTYAFTGPPGGDISVAASSITGGFPNAIGLQLQVSATTLPGAHAGHHDIKRRPCDRNRNAGGAMMRMRFESPAICAAAVFLLCAAAAATTLARMTIEQMTRASQLVVRAKCTGNSTGWDAGEIWTFSEFQVEDTWKGTPPSNLTVCLLGGPAGNLASSVPGVPRFQPGEEVVLFLEATRKGDFSVVSWVQGTFRIRRNSRTEEEWAAQDTADFILSGPPEEASTTRGALGVRIAALQARVAAAANAQDGRKP
jgi:hypothetical protein